MHRFLTIALFSLAGIAASPASEPAPIHWHGIWMNGLNVLWIVAGPTEAVAVEGAAYRQTGVKSYLDTQVDFDAIPMGDKLLLAKADGTGCAIELSYVGQQIAAHENGKCGPESVSFDGTYTRQ